MSWTTRIVSFVFIAGAQMALSILPCADTPFGAAISLLDLARGSLSGGVWTGARVVLVVALSIGMLGAATFLLAMFWRSHTGALLLRAALATQMLALGVTVFFFVAAMSA